jgi:glycosyltransferase involved in cell wall biosynthesis
MAASDIAIILPPREAFAPDAAGAVARVALSHARHGARPAIVYGRPVARPFDEVPFRPVRPRLWPGPEALRHAAAVAALLRAAKPALIEVHNRPDMALFLARRFPAVSLFLHNDPRMRAARDGRQREELRRRLARVLAVSGWVAERFGVGPGVTVLPNGFDPASLPPPRPRAAEILFAGRVVADKGADLFVAACARVLPGLPGWTARIIGADRFGPDSPETPFLRALRPRAAAAGVVMEGFQTHPRVLEAMARAAIVVVPGRWPEPFGLVALEAMASGAALIFTPRGGLPELVGDAGLAVAPEPESIAGAILALAADPAHRAGLGEAGRARAARFTASAVAARLDREREAILATWSRPRPPPI